jgi:hypothetical protein
MSEWLGHRDLCSIQWSDYCDCLEGVPVEVVEADEDNS